MSTEKTNNFEEMTVGTYNFADLIGGDSKVEEAEDTQEALPEVTEEEVTEEVVTETEDVVEEQEQEEVQEVEQLPASSEKESSYSKLAKRYIESGYWEDAKIDFNGEEVAIADIKDLDEETFFLIQEAQNEDLKDNFIDKRDWDDVTKQIHDIHQRGGDITELLKIKEQYINPLDSYDLNNEQHQEALVRQMYAIESGGVLTQEEIQARVQRDKKGLVLDQKAKAFEAKLRDSYKATLKQQEDALKAAEKKRIDGFKNLRNSVQEEMKTFGVKDSIVSTLLNNSMSLDDKGNVAVDNQFQELKKDPKRLAEFLVWYHNPEEYKKKVSGEAVTKRDADILKKLNLIPKDKGKTKTTTKKKDKRDDFASRLVEL